ILGRGLWWWRWCWYPGFDGRFGFNVPGVGGGRLVVLGVAFFSLLDRIFSHSCSGFGACVDCLAAELSLGGVAFFGGVVVGSSVMVWRMGFCLIENLFDPLRRVSVGGGGSWVG
ncbi:MAG: hypothetical protein ACREOZ_03670, partial [Gloeomargaritales cyanobacterium]